MKKGIPCFDNSFVKVENETILNYEFVCGDEEIASSRRVFLGDVDPMTGEKITDREIFSEIRRIQYGQADCNRRADCAPWTKSEKEARNEMRREIAEAFEREHGYAPDAETLEWLLKEQWPKKHRVQMDAFINEEGNTFREYLMKLEDPSAAEDVWRVECSFDEFEKTLDEKECELFQLLLRKANGFCMCGGINDLAAKWGMEQYKVSRMKKKVEQKLVKWLYED